MARQIKALTILRGNGRIETVKAAASYSGNASFDAFQASMGRVIGTDDNGLALAYAASVWAYRCVNVRATKFSTVPWRVVSKATGEPINDHPLTRAINDAYRWRGRDLMYDIEAALCIWGELYIEKMRNVFGVPSGLKWVNPLIIEPFIVQGQIQYFYVSDVFSGRSYQLATPHIGYYRLFNPMDDNRGLSPMTVALDAVNIDRSIQKSTKAWFENDSRPDYIVSPKQGEGWSGDILDRITEWWRTNLKGQKNRGKGAIIDMPIDYNQLQREPIPTQVDLSNNQAEKVCAPFGVAPSAAGRWSDVTYDNSEEQDMYLYDHTLEPEALMVDKFITSEILPFFDDTDTCEFKHDFSAIKAKAASSQKRIQAVSQVYKDGVITLNEYRVKTGEQKVAGGDFFLIPQGYVAVPAVQLANAPALLNIAPLPDIVQPSGAQVGLPTLSTPPSFPEPIPFPALPSSTDTSAAGKELGQWERATLRHGKNKALSFVCHALPDHVTQYVKAALGRLDFTDKVQVRGVFSQATKMLLMDEEDEPMLITANSMRNVSQRDIDTALVVLQSYGIWDDVATWPRQKTFEEHEHPRDDDGKFTDGGGSTGGIADAISGGSSSSNADGGSSSSGYDKPFSEKHSSDLSEKAIGKLDKKQRKAVEGYSGIDARIINDNLRGQESFRVLNDADRAQIDTIDKAIASNKLSDDTSLYRGFTLSKKGISKVKVGQTITDKAFVSTSLNPDVAFNYSGAKAGVTKEAVIMKIKAPKGTAGLPMSTLSEWPGEHEVLLPRGTTFKITSMTKKKGVTYVDAEIVNG